MVGGGGVVLNESICLGAADGQASSQTSLGMWQIPQNRPALAGRLFSLSGKPAALRTLATLASLMESHQGLETGFGD